MKDIQDFICDILKRKRDCDCCATSCKVKEIRNERNKNSQHRNRK